MAYFYYNYVLLKFIFFILINKKFKNFTVLEENLKKKFFIYNYKIKIVKVFKDFYKNKQFKNILDLQTYLDTKNALIIGSNKTEFYINSNYNLNLQLSFLKKKEFNFFSFFFSKNTKKFLKKNFCWRAKIFLLKLKSVC